MYYQRKRPIIGCKEFHAGLKKMLGKKAPSYRAFRPIWVGLTKIIEVSLLEGYMIQFLGVLSVWYEDIPAKEPRETVFAGKVITTKAKPARRRLKARAKGLAHKMVFEENQRAQKVLDEQDHRTPEQKAEEVKNYPLQHKSG